MIEIMNKRMNHIVWLLIAIFFIGTSWYMGKKYLKERNDRLRVTQSFIASNQLLEYYKSRNGDLVANNQALLLKVDELKKIYPEILSEIRNIKINPNRVNSYTENVIESEKQITTVLRDSIINDTIVVKVFNYRDNFYLISGIAKGDSQIVNIISKDSIIQVVYKGERIRPWLWIFSHRRLEQAITCKNPNATVVYSKYIEIIKP